MNSTAPSPFSPHFNTNYIPSDSEIYEIRNIIRSHQVVIDDIERQIRELEDRRRLHTKVVEQHSAILSPIKRMPTYILSLIFLTCLQSRPFLEGRSRHPAVIISHVCHQWRTIALDSPLLWSKINISMFHSPYPPYAPDDRLQGTDYTPKPELTHPAGDPQLIRDMAAEWIRRSAHCPLDIAFSCAESAWRAEFNAHHGEGELISQQSVHEKTSQSVILFLVDLLLSVVDQWKRISFFLTTHSSNSPLLRLLEVSPGELSQLEDLHIALNLHEEYMLDIHRESTPRTISLLEAPRLRSLVLSRILGPDDMLPVNYSTLTELYLHDPDGYGGFNASLVLRVLAACPDLVRCRVDLESRSRFYYGPFNMAQPPPWRVPDEKITLPHLVSMSIQGTSLPQDFGSSFDLPSLRTLSVLCHSTDPEDEENSGFVNWVRNFGDALTDVSFEHPALTQSALLYTLEHLPNLVTLRMLDSGSVFDADWSLGGASLEGSAKISDSVLARLTPSHLDDALTERGNYLCPRLESFSCRMTRVEFTEQGLVDFIVGRRQYNTTSSLKHVVVKFNTPRGKDIMAELENRGIDMEGFSAVIKYYEPPLLKLDADLEGLPPYDRMAASSVWTVPGGAEWWWS
ncbi:hypothetical protein MD484_g5493, partial [Candolleomyces efflorescens]